MKSGFVDIHASLIAKCKQGDRRAQHEVYKLYARAMYNAAYRILRNQEDAKDIVQESFIDMYTKLDSFRGDASFGAWFRRIVVNKSLNYLKKHRHVLIDLGEVDVMEEENEITSFDYELGDVQKAMTALPEGYRLVFDLYMFEGYTHREIGEELGIAETTSKSQLSRAKVKLVELLNASKN